MKLLAVNSQWAVYGAGCGSGELDAFSALRNLLSVRNFQQLVRFLIDDACNESFLVSADTDFADSFRREERIWHRDAADIVLQGSLDQVIDPYPDIDYLDALTVRDLEGSELFQLDLTELIDFQQIMRRFLTVAAVSLGAPAPDGLFREIPSDALFGEEWIRDNLHCSPSKLHTIGLKREDAGFRRNGLFCDDVLDAGIFRQTDGYSRYQLILDKSKEFGKYTDGFPFSVDGVIYTYSECDLSVDIDGSDDARLSSTDYCATVSYLDDVAPERAKILLAGRVIESMLNSYLNIGGQTDFSYPYCLENDSGRYRFLPGRGFVEKRIVDPSWWVTELYDEAVSLILDSKVSLCPVCGSPVLIKDFRGRKSKLVCSDSCKTRASNRRREVAYQCAARGVSLGDAIECIGQEYEFSVRRWYEEALALAVR